MADEKNHTTRRRRSTAEINELLEALAQSGLTRAAFARKHNLGYSTLCKWVHRNRRKSQTPGWLEVSDVIRTPGEASTSPYRLHWPDGINLELGRDFDSQKVGELISLIRSQCSL